MSILLQEIILSSLEVDNNMWTVVMKYMIEKYAKTEKISVIFYFRINGDTVTTIRKFKFGIVVPSLHMVK